MLALLRWLGDQVYAALAGVLPTRPSGQPDTWDTDPLTPGPGPGGGPQ